MIRVNEVIMMRIDGAKDKTVSSATIWMTRPETVPSSSLPRSTVMPCAKEECVNANKVTAAASAANKNFADTRRLNIFCFNVGFYDSFSRRAQNNKMFGIVASDQYRFSACIKGQNFHDFKAAFLVSGHADIAQIELF